MKQAPGESSVNRLFKYRRFNDHTLRIIECNELWFSSPREFNDPFDCKPQFVFSDDYQERLAFAVGIVRRKHPNSPESKILRVAKKELAKTPESNFQKALPDIHRAGLALLENSAICCFTAVSDDILMWSHYADGHKGLCLEFEATNRTRFFGAAQRVTYKGSFPVVRIGSLNSEEWVEAAFLTKSSRWSYEYEWRIVEPDKGPGKYIFPGELLKSVILGCMMQDENKVKIKKVLARRPHSVKLYEAKQKRGEFALELVPQIDIFT